MYSYVSTVQCPVNWKRLTSAREYVVQFSMKNYNLLSGEDRRNDQHRGYAPHFVFHFLVMDSSTLNIIESIPGGEIGIADYNLNQL